MLNKLNCIFFRRTFALRAHENFGNVLGAEWLLKKMDYIKAGAMDST